MSLSICEKENEHVDEVVNEVVEEVADNGEFVEEDEKFFYKKDKDGNIIEKIAKSGLSGAAISALKNSLKYIVKVGGRRSNVVSVFDKTARSALGNPKWFARVDMPHGNVNFPHINVNKAIIGVKDPHIKISPGAANVAGTVGSALNVVNKVAPVLMVASAAYDAVQIGKCVSEDLENQSSRNTVKKVATTVSSYAGGFGGASAGAAIGTAIFPGVGTLLGALIGGITGGIGASVGSEIASEVILEEIGYDVHMVECKKCKKLFQCRVHETGWLDVCPSCKENP